MVNVRDGSLSITGTGTTDAVFHEKSRPLKHVLVAFVLQWVSDGTFASSVLLPGLAASVTDHQTSYLMIMMSISLRSSPSLLVSWVDGVHCAKQHAAASGEVDSEKLSEHRSLCSSISALIKQLMAYDYLEAFMAFSMADISIPRDCTTFDIQPTSHALNQLRPTRAYFSTSMWSTFIAAASVQ